MDCPRQLRLKASITLADQAVTSAAAFCLNILLVRWMEPFEYGAFVTAFAVFLFLSRFHQALLLEPMAVFAWSEYKGRLAEYLRTSLHLHWVIGCGLGLLPAMAGFAFGSAGFRQAWTFAAMGVAAPMVLLQWTLRRMAYLAGDPALALRGAAVYAFALIAGICGLQYSSRLSPEAVWLVPAIGALASSASMWPGVGLAWKRQPGARADWRAAALLHWSYGRWAAAFSATDALSEALYLPLIAAVLGLRQAGLFRAMENLLQPIQMTMASFALLGLPIIAETLKTEGHRFLAQAGRKVPAATAILCGSYAVLLVGAAPGLIRFLYGREAYAEALGILPLLAVTLVCRTLGDGSWGILIRAASRPDVMFWGSAAGAAVSLLFGVPCLLFWGIKGAAIARMASAAVFMLSVLAGFLVILKGSRPDAALRAT